jgi:hypothetical protein
MNSELLYFCLMGLGWLFLIGWAVALVTACAIAFRQNPSPPNSASPGPQIAGKVG